MRGRDLVAASIHPGPCQRTVQLRPGALFTTRRDSFNRSSILNRLQHSFSFPKKWGFPATLSCSMIEPMKKTLLALVAILCFTFAASAADISGKWMRDPNAAPPAGGGGGGGRGGGGGGTYEFKVSGTTLSGTVTTPGRGGGDPTVVTIEKGKVDGNSFTFSITRPGRGGGDPTTTVYNGKIDGDKLVLSFDMGRGPQEQVLVKAP